MASPDTTTIPILLLKTKSTPNDAYEELFSSSQASKRNDGKNQLQFDPRFVPVMLHHFLDAGLDTIRSHLQNQEISRQEGAKYGGMIFTSQRAVEAVKQIYSEDLNDEQRRTLLDVPIYSVGPATTRCLLDISPQTQFWGSHTGNGEALARYILEHYPPLPSSASRALLFPVGEQRRDIIPKTLMADSLPADKRIRVAEEVVYSTGVMESFADNFAGMLAETSAATERWVVVFSPTGCEAMLRCLGLLDDNGRAKIDSSGTQRSTFTAAIGPTTRDYLINTFGFTPDVCAGAPSPEGVRNGILEHISRRI